MKLCIFQKAAPKKNIIDILFVVLKHVRLAERTKAVSLSLTLIEIEGSNPSPDKNLHFVASLLLFNTLQSPKMKYFKVIDRLHIKGDRTQEQYKGLVAEH